MSFEVAPEIISAIISGLISGAVTSAIAMTVFYFKWLLKVDKRVVSLETKIEPLWEGITKMVSKKIAGETNPSSNERTRELLKKLEAGSLSHQEAKELKEILERELEKARKEKDDSLLVNLTILLSALESIIERTAPKEVKAAKAK